jgi:hypothetical protein
MTVTFVKIDETVAVSKLLVLFRRLNGRALYSACKMDRRERLYVEMSQTEGNDGYVHQNRRNGRYLRAVDLVSTVEWACITFCT